MRSRIVSAAAAACVVWFTCLGFAWGAPRPSAAAGKAAAAGPAEIVLLGTPDPRGWSPNATIWRYLETWQTDLARLADGRLMRVDPLNPRVGFAGSKIWEEQGSGRNHKQLRFSIRAAGRVVGSPPPPADWRQPQFDDGDWIRTPRPMGSHYRSLAVVCLRGKFEVDDPAQVEELSLAASFQGGVVAYLNGHEVARASLPQGKIDFETLADDYPKEVYLASPNCLLTQTNASSAVIGEDDASQVLKDAGLADRYKRRFRHLRAALPAKLLQKGVNVLAIEVHRAAADESMFTLMSPKEMGYNVQDNRSFWWNRASLEGLKLTAKAPPAAVAGNLARPKGIQAWNWPVAEPIDLRTYGDPNEPLGPIRLCGARNGAYSGQIVVSSPAAIQGLTAEAGALRAPGGGVIPAGRVLVRFPQIHARSSMGFAALEPAVPGTIAAVERREAGVLAMQPVWVTVEVPRDAPAGDYTGTLSVRAEGLARADVPIRLHVSGWALPEPQDFTTHMGFVQSPDSVAMRYGVPMWSEPHWRLIERSLAVLGKIATKELTIPLVRKSQFGNEHAMLWWVRQEDGSYQPDCQVVARYVALAAKHLGKIPVVIFYVSEGEEDRTIPWLTGFDPRTGEWAAIKGPRWGTAEARDFWKPAIAGFRQVLARHGLQSALAFGYHADGGNGPECAKECIADLKELAPEARWVRLGHGWFGNQRLDCGPNGNPYARVALVGNYAVYWDPEHDRPFYGWQNPYVVTAYPRDQYIDRILLRHYRFGAEAILLTGQRDPPAGWGLSDFAGEFGRNTFLGMRGFAPAGGDFWPVLGDRRGYHDIIARFNDPGAGHWDPRGSWSTVALNGFQNTFIVGDGQDGPVSSVQVEVLREGLQEAEARVFVQNALLQPERAERLGPDLARRAKRLCDQRTWELRYLTEYAVTGYCKAAWPAHYLTDYRAWQQRSRELYDLAAEVAAALGNRRPGKEAQP
jgi:hypothetical protein